MNGIKRGAWYIRRKLRKVNIMTSLLLLSFSALSFFIGCYIGYGGLGIYDESRFTSLTIPFLSMLGSWVSGVGALMAVIVSLLIALRASKENTEELDIQYSLALVPSYHASAKSEVDISINITNMRRMRSNIQAVSFNFSNNKDLYIFINPALLKIGKIPHVLEDYGDRLSLIVPSALFSSVQEDWFIENCNEDDVGECSIVVQTTTKRFTKKLTPKQTEQFNQRFKEKIAEHRN